MNRIEVAQNHLGELDALIIDDPIDLYYLTGLDLSLGRLLIEHKSAKLFVDGRYFQVCKNQAPVDVTLWDWKTPFPLSKGEHIGFDSQKMTYAQVEKLKASGAKLVPLKSPISKQREVKENGEIEKLREAANLGMEGFLHVIEHLKVGVTELEVARELEIFWLKKGGMGLAFDPIIAFGENGSKPHYHVSERRLVEGDSVLVDLGVVLNHYHSDMTRVLFFGESSMEMEKIYHIVLEAQEKSLSLCRPGVSVDTLYQAAKDVIEGHGYELVHSLGHGIGLEVHEAPRIASGENLLVENMVITIEPGVYVPGVGGVRIEDTIVITSDGFDNLTELTQKSPYYL